MDSARRIGILAGGGTLPREIADSVAARGQPLHIVALDGEADADFGPHPVTRVNWGEIGRMVDTFKEAATTDLVIIGSVKRPDLAAIKPDIGFFSALGTVLGLVVSGGDDAVLRGVNRFFEKRGFRIASPAEIAPELVIGSGAITPAALTEAEIGEARRGFTIIAELGRFDIGQAAVVANGRLEALEAAEGTDGMLDRLARQRRGSGHSQPAARGLLVKRTKPGQDRRIDLPVIGPHTVTRAMECGLGALVVEAGSALAADRAELLRRAAASNLKVSGLESPAPSATALQQHSSTRSLSARLIGAMRTRRTARKLPLRKLGRHPIPTRILRDVLRGLQVIEALRPYGGSRAVAVVRGHVLAVETGEGAATALQRAAGLRQWGDRHLRRRAGVVVIDAGRDCAVELVEITATGRFAGLIVKLRRFTAGVPEDTIAAADKSGLFIAGLQADDEADHD